MTAGSRDVVKKRSMGSGACAGGVGGCPAPGGRSEDRRGGIERREFAFGAAEIERAERLMNEHRPSGGADDERDRHASAEGAQLISALAAAIGEALAAAVELRTAFAESEDGRGARVET